jgi:hypothetical protein
LRPSGSSAGRTDLVNEAWKVLWFQNNKAVGFESGVYKAVIMPLNYME